MLQPEQLVHSGQRHRQVVRKAVDDVDVAEVGGDLEKHARPQQAAGEGDHLLSPERSARPDPECSGRVIGDSGERAGGLHHRADQGEEEVIRGTCRKRKQTKVS